VIEAEIHPLRDGGLLMQVNIPQYQFLYKYVFSILFWKGLIYLQF
jgi:hypothetical protein